MYTLTKFFVLSILILLLDSCKNVAYKDLSSELKVVLVDTTSEYVQGDTLVLTAQITNFGANEVSLPIRDSIFLLVPKPIVVNDKFISWHWPYWFRNVTHHNEITKGGYLKLHGKEERELDIKFIGEDMGAIAGPIDFYLRYLVSINTPEQKVRYEVYSQNTISIEIKKK